MISSVLTVSQVNLFVKSLIDGDGRLGDIFITGEISNFTNHYKSGHLYFSLKDERSVLKSVMFASAARRLKFAPKDGMKVIIRGRVSVYEPSGQYQLYAEDMQPDGIGALNLAFEQLKEKLAEEGLFAMEHKKELPAYPERIGIVTSPTGAAVQDILQITGRRWPLAEIVFCPVLVQGDGAASQITGAVQKLDGRCDVMIVGRGGGSLEDLWAFNDEGLARAVYRAETPVVSAVGHETDFTICDFAADLRAPTPSAAAELCTPDIRDEMGKMAAYNRYFLETAQKTVEYFRQSVDLLVVDSPLAAPRLYVEENREKVGEMLQRLEQGFSRKLEREKAGLSLWAQKLDALSPLKVLARGYAVVYGRDGNAVKCVKDAKVGETVSIRLSDGRLRADITESEAQS